MKIMLSFWSSAFLFKRGVFLLLVSLFLAGCNTTPPAGTKLRESDVHYVSQDGYTLAFKDVVIQSPTYFIFGHEIYCKLDTPKILPAKTVNITFRSKHGSIYDLSYRAIFNQSEIGQWKLCSEKNSKFANQQASPYIFNEIEIVNIEGCTSQLNGGTLPDGSQVFGKMCGGELVSGVQIKKNGDIFKCASLNSDDKITVFGEDQDLRCLNITSAGNLASVENYALDYYKKPYPNGVQLRDFGTQFVAEYASDGGRKVADLEAEVQRFAIGRFQRQLEKKRAREAKARDKEIKELDSLIQQAKKDARHLSQVKRQYGNKNLVDQCHCELSGMSCLRLESNDPSERLTDSEWRVIEASSFKMCKALKQAGIIKVVEQEYGYNRVVAGDGSNAAYIQQAFESNDFSGLRVSGEAGELFREAQREHNAIKQLIIKRQKAERDKQKALEYLAQERKRERDDQVAALVAESKRKAALLAEREQEAFVDFKICLSRYGIDYDTRENWSALPSDCM